MSELISKKITEAIEFSLLAHDGQLRKDARPFIIHPLSVGYILLSEGYPEDVVIAGILHDVIEDTEYSFEYLEEKFGEKIAKLVSGVTEDTSIKDWTDRKKAYLDHLKTASDEVKAISAADMLDNRRAILRSLNEGFDLWKSFSATPQEIIKNSEERLAIVQVLENDITRELERVITEIKKLI